MESKFVMGYVMGISIVAQMVQHQGSVIGMIDSASFIALKFLVFLNLFCLLIDGV